ncbi:hypothetical protein AB0C34_03355 [Nocardia sp. NPDC049220]|uniref:hypothetical protein n=1 Tax=Nocardia sp. NPDC049220 TaxID=3155273 RepID=UPI0034089743
MSKPLEVDLDGLRAHGATVEKIGEQARQMVEGLRRSLALEGRPWGDNESGKAFEKYYLPDAEKGLAGLGALAQALSSFGSQLTAAANSFEAQDRHGAVQLHNTGGRPAEPGADDASPPGHTLPGAVGGEPRWAPSSSTADKAWDPAPPTGSDESAVPDAADRSASPSPGDTGSGTPQPTDGSTEQPGAMPGAPYPRPDRDTRPGAPPAVNSSVSADRNHSAATTPRRGETAAVPQPVGKIAPQGVTAPNAGKPPGTPWSRAGAQPPRRTADETPRPTPKPTPRRRKDPDKKPRPAPTAAPWPHTDPVAVERLARSLAARHDIDVVGFNDPHLDHLTVAEFATALDDVLTRYRVPGLRVVEISPLAGTVVATRRDDVIEIDGRMVSHWSVVLDAGVAKDRRRLAEVLAAIRSPEPVVACSTERPVYAATVRQLGRVLDLGAGGVARRRAQRALIAEYLELVGTGHYSDDLGRVLRGFKHWRSALSGRSFEHGRLEPGEALAEAFTDVVLNGRYATAPARTLHRHLVESTQGDVIHRRWE